MAVGSWVGSDIFPTLEPFARIIEGKSSRMAEKVEGKSSRSVKGKEKAIMIADSDDDTDCEWKEGICYE